MLEPFKSHAQSREDHRHLTEASALLELGEHHLAIARPHLIDYLGLLVVQELASVADAALDDEEHVADLPGGDTGSIPRNQMKYDEIRCVDCSKTSWEGGGGKASHANRVYNKHLFAVPFVGPHPP